MKRLLWLGIGLAVGGLVVRAVSRRAQAYSPAGIAGAARETAGGLLTSVRSFVDDVRDGMAERERQINEAMLAGVTLRELGDDTDLEYPTDRELDGRELDGREYDDREDQEGIR